MEMLKQPQNSPWPLQHQVALAYAGTRGLIDNVEKEELHKWEHEFLRYVDTVFTDMGNELAAGKWTDDIEASLKQCIADFNTNWDSQA